MSLNRITLSCRVSVLLIVFIIYLENPVDGFVNSPKIITKDGNLIVESGLNRNITFRLDGSSRININDEYDLLDLLLVGGTYNGSSSKRKDVIETDNLIQLSNEYNTLRSYVFGTNGLNRRLNTMLNRTRIYNRSIQRFQTRLQSVERRVQSLQQRLELDSCKSNPCDNGGTCINMFGSFLCQCTKNFEGATCQKDVNECALYAGTDLGCQNGGQCVNQHGGYNCICTAGWYGIHCTQRKGDCMQSSSWELCGHGTCVSSNDDFGYKCICDVGWKTNGLTPSCTVDVDECNESHPPCETKCINLPGSFTCSPCAAGLTGNGVNCRDIDECATQNGGCSMSPRVACINSYGSYHCGDCPLGWIGDGRTCERRGGSIDGNGATATSCALNNYCHPLAKCTEVSNTVVCSCPAGMVGSGVGLNGCVPNTHQRCDVLPCMNGGTCVESNDKFICMCPMGYTGPTCADITNSCSPNPCRNNGRCRSTGGTQFECRCAPGFSGRLCDARFSRCGGILTGMTGHLKYPQGSAYDHMAQCAWVIRTNDSLVLNVTFSAFELEDATECRFDWLQINDGRTAAAQIIGRFCGTRKPRGGNIISSSSDLYLWFRSDNSTAKAGFELDWNSIPPQCGGIIELESHGTVSSPGSPGNYPKNRDCQWHLKAPNNKRIKLTFFSLQIENHDSCNFDYLEIIDAIAESTIVKYCNSTAPSPLLLPTNEAIIRFHSDNIDTDAGFQIYYSTEERVPGCGGTYTAKQGTITSPNTLEDSISCEYDIKMPISESIRIEFKKVELGDDDCLEFFDINPSTQELTLQAKYCGAYNSDPPVLLHSLYNGLRIKYFAKRGKFELKYESDCSYTYESPNGIVMSPGYPVLSNIERFCNYKITTEPNTVISVKFLDFDIKDSSVDASGCAFSSLRINDGLNQNIMGPYCGNNTPPIEFVSKANMLVLTFKTGITTWGKGFKLEYLSIPMGKTDCGGVFTKPGQKIRLPTGENGVYLDNMECYWVIMAPEGKGIMINWNSFRLESTMDCMYDYVEIFDTLPKADDTHALGRFCESPPSFSSYSRLLTLKFVSDSSESDAGFEATYEFLDLSKHCGGEIFSSTGRFYSPDYPSNYTNGVDCIWVINAPENTQMKLDFDMFELQASDNCENDWLEVRNGGSEKSPLINKYCGTLIPRQIPSFTHQMRIHFHSDNFINARGFQIHWAVYSNGCGGNINADSGVIASPRYPNPYPHNAECDWHIQVPKGSSIHFTIEDLSIEELFNCHYDFLEIFNGRSDMHPLLAKLCQLERDEPKQLYTTSNEALLRFRTDGSQRERGFLLSYYANCSRTITDINGVIESPNYGNPYFKDPINCSWTIQAPKGNKIVLQFSHYEKSEGGHDLIFKEPGKNETLFHLLSLNENYTTTGNVLSIIQNTTWMNFRLEYAMFGCVQVFHRATGEFESPNHPLPYPNDIECMWEIITTPGQGVELTVTDLDIEETVNCTNDALVISSHMNSTNNKERHCGRQDSLVITSSSHQLYVRFISNKEHNGKGFKASYKILKSQCGGVLASKNGVITSPNYPLNYPPDARCEWTIEVNPHHTITLTLEEIEMENYYSCEMDFVEAYENANSDSDRAAQEAQEKLLFKECGFSGSAQNEWVTTTNTAVVRFESDDSMQEKGFKLAYKENCGQNILLVDDDVGYLAISRNVVTNETCEWHLVAKDLSKHVQFTPIHVQLSPLISLSAMLEEDCMEQGVKIYDGVDRTAPLRSKFCKTHPANVISNGHALTITVPMNVTTEFEGYYQLMDNWCGGYYMSLSGKFASPYYPSSYPVNIDCEWYIAASEGNSIVLTIEAFDTELSDGCNKDYLEVRESTESGRLMGLFCGSDIPSPITGLQTVWIKFGSDNDVVGNGFIASYNYATHNELNGKNGTIQSPHYPTKFRTDEPYTWRITVDKDYVLLLLLSHIIDVDMPFIKIYDGYSDIGLQIDYSNTHYVHSSTNIVYIKSYRGPFQIDWTTISKEDFKNNQTLEENAALCGRNSYSIDTSIFINSPGYPDGYAPSLNCSWVLMPKNPATHVVLQIAKVDLEDISECSADYITISASSDMQNWEEPARFCNKKEQEFKDYHGNPYLRLSFVTDSSVNKTGFSTSAHVECGAVMTERQALVNLTAILSDRSRFQTECVWKINVRQSRRIRIRFLESNLAPDNQVTNCRTYFLLRNGLAEDSPFLGKGKYCENNIEDVLETTSNRAFIKFSRINLGPNFKAAFHYEEIAHECSDMLVLSEDTPDDRTKTINSPSYPNIPNPHSECIWRVTAPMHHIIAIEFKGDFDLVPSDSQSGACDREYVQLNDGATELMPMIGLFCGKTKPNTKFTTGNVLRVKYYTDISEPHVGFQAVVSIGRCGGSYYEPDGEIVSPDSALVKDARDLECVYTIEVERGSTIKLVVEKMELPDTEGCSADSNLELQEIVSYEGADNVTDSLRICGSRKNRNYVVESSKLVIRYHIKEFRPTHTFKLTYTTIGTRCGETITAPRGTLFTPGYPQGVTRPTHCAWKIRVPKGKRVKVEILDFDIGAGLNVTNSFGHSSSFRGRLSFANDFEMQSIIARVTTNPPAAVYSTDNIMAIDAFLLSFTQHRGFRLRFSSDEDSQVCQHNVQLANGEGLMHFRRNNDSDIYCSYMLKMQDNQTLTLAVEKYERNATSALYVSFCGYMSPLKLELNTQQILPELLCKNETHAVARLPYPVTMKLMGNRRNRLINLELKYKVYECGGIRSIYNDLNITEPQMANYSGVLECAWAVWPDHEFSVDDMDDLDYWAAGTQIEVSLSTDFKDNCEDQYLLVYGGPNQNFPHLGRFCTQSSMENMVVERGVFVEYYTRNYETQSKFNLTLKQGSGCGGTLTYPFRPITFSDQYKNNIECVWTLSTEAGFHIGLYFTDRFFIETSQNCTKDYLLVQQKTTNGTWEDLGRYCGREPPQSVNSTTTEMRLIFRTDADTLGDGFTANFDRNCGGILYATAEQQYIVSPGYPVRYPNNLNCNYTVIPKVPIKTGVLVDFVDFEIESPPITRCLFDNVTVYTRNDGNIAETVHCGTQRAHGFRGDQVSVILRTDHSFASRGFKLAYSTNVCGYTVRNTTLIETPRQFTDGTFPPNTECFWNLTAPDDYKILIKFEFFDYEGDTNCDFDGVKIYKSLYPVENERIAKFCGNLTGIIPPLHIPGNRGLIHTYSDRSINSVGFKALITFIPNCDQKIHLDANNASYDFMKYANGYANNLDCAYVFTTTSGRQLFADFNSFHVEDSAKCQDDFLEVRDGGGPFGDLIGQFCGHVVPARMMSSQNALFMRFVSDSAETSAGFSLKISSSPKICGNMELEVKSKEQLVLKSPNAGQQLYGKHLNCLWKLKSTRTIHLKFEHMDLEGSNVTGQCGGDTLKIYNKEDAYEVERGYGTEVIHNGQMGGGQWSNYATNHVYCGNQLPDDYYSTGNTLIVKFQTDDEIEKTGFTLNAYAVEGCFRNFTGTQGFVQLADTTDECDVYIEAPQNYTLSLYYSDVIFAEYECVKEYVEVFDSHTNSSLQKICSYTGNDKALFSSTNKLRIHLKMSGYYTRFEFTYLASQDGPGCGGNIYNTRGTIVNPFYPNNVRNNSDCRWNIRVPANLHILLSFDEFDLGTKNTCHSDYLEVIERDDDGIEGVVRRFCGGDNPKKYKSTRSSLSIRFHKTVNYDGTGWVINFTGVFANYKIPDYMLM